MTRSTGDQYFVGDFDASQSFSGLPDGDCRVWMGWLSNWDYAKAEPTSPWRGMQSVPREIRLVAAANGFALAQRPIREIETLRGPVSTIEPGEVAGRRVLPFSGDAFDAEAVLRPGTARLLGLAVRVGDGEETLVGYELATFRFFVDRTRSGGSDFHPAFAGRHSGPLALEQGLLRLRILVDRSSVEAFAGDGRLAISDRIYPRADEPRRRRVRRRRQGRDRVSAGMAPRGSDSPLTPAASSVAGIGAAGTAVSTTVYVPRVSVTRVAGTRPSNAS